MSTCVSAMAGASGESYARTVSERGKIEFKLELCFDHRNI